MRKFAWQFTTKGWLHLWVGCHVILGEKLKNCCPWLHMNVISSWQKIKLLFLVSFLHASSWGIKSGTSLEIGPTIASPVPWEIKEASHVISVCEKLSGCAPLLPVFPVPSNVHLVLSCRKSSLGRNTWLYNQAWHWLNAKKKQGFGLINTSSDVSCGKYMDVLMHTRKRHKRTQFFRGCHSAWVVLISRNENWHLTAAYKRKIT